MSDEDAGHDLYDTSAEDYAAGYRDGQREAWAKPPPGYRLVPEVPTAWMRDCLRTWLGREFRVFPSDRMLDAVCRDMLQVQAAPGAKEEDGS